MTHVTRELIDYQGLPAWQYRYYTDAGSHLGPILPCPPTVDQRVTLVMDMDMDMDMGPGPTHETWATYRSELETRVVPVDDGTRCLCGRLKPRQASTCQPCRLSARRAT